MDAPDTAKQYEVTVSDDWTEAEILRHFSSNWIGALTGSDAARDAVGMVTAELLENALRYGSAGASIDYRVRWQDGWVDVFVTSSYGASSRSVEELCERLSWLNAQSSPVAAYMGQLRRVSDEESTGVGLARVSYEGNSHLTCEVDTSLRQVTVRAELRESFRRHQITSPEVKLFDRLRTSTRQGG